MTLLASANVAGVPSDRPRALVKISSSAMLSAFSCVTITSGRKCFRSL